MGDSPRRVLFATSSRGKLAEGRQALEPLGIEVVGLGDLGLAGEVPEDQPDYEGNARLKARHWARCSGLAVLADDSGLEVDALDGRPGVWSARYGGPGLDDLGRNRKLLAELSGVPPGRRGARFVCVLVLVGPDGEDLAVARGERRGRILEEPRGAGGFGYDPLFVPDGLGLSFAELAPVDKQRQSHRGRAFRSLVARLGVAGRPAPEPEPD